MGIAATFQRKSEIEEAEVSTHARENPDSVYSEDAIKAFILSKRSVLKNKFELAQAALVGSNWVIKRFDTLFITTHTLKDARGSSYIPTPEVLCNSKLGLINTKMKTKNVSNIVCFNIKQAR